VPPTEAAQAAVAQGFWTFDRERDLTDEQHVQCCYPWEADVEGIDAADMDLWVDTWREELLARR
jgi:hypothetical protein